MKMPIHSLLAFALLVLLSACGSTSNIKPTLHSSTAGNAAETLDLSGYNTVVVENLKSPQRSASGAKFSALLAKAIENENLFDSVLRTPVGRKSLVITGEVTTASEGNKHLRMWIGFGAGQSAFRANVILKDAASSQTLGTVDVNQHSNSVLGGIFIMRQDTERLMSYSIEKIIAELKKAKGIK
jgi:hypothetical protein